MPDRQVVALSRYIINKSKPGPSGAIGECYDQEIWFEFEGRVKKEKGLFQGKGTVHNLSITYYKKKT